MKTIRKRVATGGQSTKRLSQMGIGMLAALWLAGTVQAWQPAEWVYMDWPWAYDSASADWHWFTADGEQWIYAYPPGAGWALLQQSSLAQGWSYWDGEWAYDGDTGAWCWRNTADTQWSVNMRTEIWSRFGEQQVSESAVLSFVIDSGAALTRSRTVALNNACTGGPTQYMASESASFSGASWQTYATAPVFTLSAGNETKTVYFKVLTADGPSGVSSDTIELAEGETGLYLVVDLSGGSEASSYPVTYLNAVPGGSWTDEYKTTKLVLLRVPRGSGMFVMGSPTNELNRMSIDETQHTVTLTKDFYLGVFEVTQRQWELVMGTNPSYFTNATYYATRPVERVSYYEIRENPLPVIDGEQKGGAINPHWPQSSQVHADSFMGKLRIKTGLSGFDLPTESQWEFACRAGTTTALNSGDNMPQSEDNPQMDAVGRYVYNGWDPAGPAIDTSGGTDKAGMYLSNAWGLYDMHGNVSEWCLDRYYAYYPGTVSDPVGSVTGSSRVLRGGHWHSFASDCRSAARGLYSPSFQSKLFGLRASCAPPDLQ